MRNDFISIVDAANELGKRKQTVFRVVKRLGIACERRRSPEKHGQLMAYITKDQFASVSDEMCHANISEATPSISLPADVGCFYLIQLEPGLDPGRFKVGFATNLEERLRKHRCTSPLAQVVESWPCKLVWECTARDCVSQGCERLHTEVFRAKNLDEVASKCNQFFALMPNPVSDK